MSLKIRQKRENPEEVKAKYQHKQRETNQDPVRGPFLFYNIVKESNVTLTKQREEEKTEIDA